MGIGQSPGSQRRSHPLPTRAPAGKCRKVLLIALPLGQSQWDQAPFPRGDSYCRVRAGAGGWWWGRGREAW